MIGRLCEWLKTPVTLELWTVIGLGFFAILGLVFAWVLSRIWKEAWLDDQINHEQGQAEQVDVFCKNRTPETNKEVAEIGGFSVICMDELRQSRPEVFNRVTGGPKPEAGVATGPRNKQPCYNRAREALTNAQEKGSNPV